MLPKREEIGIGKMICAIGEFYPQVVQSRILPGVRARKSQKVPANKLILWCYFPTVTPEMDGSALIRAASGFKTMLHIRGDRGHPCLMPLGIANGQESISSTYT